MQAFAAELEANKDRLEKLEDEGTSIAKGDKERAPDMEGAVEELEKLWKELGALTKAKEKRLFEAHKTELVAEVSNIFPPLSEKICRCCVVQVVFKTTSELSMPPEQVLFYCKSVIKWETL